MSQILERFRRKPKKYKIEMLVHNDKGIPIRKFEVLAWGRSKKSARQNAAKSLSIKAGRTWLVVDK